MIVVFVFATFGVCYGVDIESCIDIQNCCMERRLCYTRAWDLEKDCCEDSFVDGSFDLKKYGECIAPKVVPDVEYCLAAMGEECAVEYAKFISENQEKFTALENSIIDAVGFPTKKENCENFLERLEKEEFERCIETDDRAIKLACDLFLRQIHDRHHTQCDCENNFSKCLSNSITVPEVENIYISCCKESVGNENTYYDLSDECIIRKLFSRIAYCFKSMRKECETNIMSHLIEAKESLEEFNKELGETVGVPPSAEYCEIYYEKEMKIVLGICKDNNSKSMAFLCTVIQRIFESGNELR